MALKSNTSNTSNTSDTSITSTNSKQLYIAPRTLATLLTGLSKYTTNSKQLLTSDNNGAQHVNNSKLLVNDDKQLIQQTDSFKNPYYHIYIVLASTRIA